MWAVSRTWQEHSPNALAIIFLLVMSHVFSFSTTASVLWNPANLCCISSGGVLGSSLSQFDDVMMKCPQGNLHPLAGHPEVYMFIFQWRHGCSASGHFRVTAGVITRNQMLRFRKREPLYLLKREKRIRRVNLQQKKRTSEKGNGKENVEQRWLTKKGLLLYGSIWISLQIPLGIWYTRHP